MAVKLGIVAGGGELPARLVEVCRANGREIFVLAFEGQTEPATVEGVDHAWVRLGHSGPALEALRGAGVEDLVLIGPVKRPSVSELGFDLRSARFLARVGAGGLGDDGLLSAVIRALEKEGFHVVGVDDLLSDLLAPVGPLGAHRPDAQAEGDITRGIAVARALGEVDVGQAVVVQQGIVLGVEAVEGSQCRSIVQPTPIASPSTCATIGLGNDMIASRKIVDAGSAPGERGLKSLTSLPLVKTPSAPFRMTTCTSGSIAAPFSSSARARYMD